MGNAIRKTKTKTKTKETQTCFKQASVEDSDQQSTQPGALIGYNDDILTSILLRLPVTSILRFKSVSKHWRSLLSHPHFTHRYDILSKSKSPGLLSRNIYVPFDVENPSSTPPFRSLDFYFNRSGVEIVQSCNGLLLCCSGRGSGGYTVALNYYVFNPTTKQLAMIPPIPPCGRNVRKTIHFMGLAFHQTDCVHYKVVCIRSLVPYEDVFQIQIYSSNTRKWKISIESFCGDSNAIFKNGVYWNGSVHWTPIHGTHLYFKIDVEQLQTLPLPEWLMAFNISPMYFGESRGHLHLIVYQYHHQSRLPLNVYEMLSDHSDWFVKYQVQLDELPGAFPEMLCKYGYGFSVIDVVRGEEEEDTSLVLQTRENIITYSVHDKSFRKIFSLTGSSSDDDHPPSFHRYTKTLSSF